MIPKLYGPITWVSDGTTSIPNYLPGNEYIGPLYNAISCKVTRAMDAELTYSLELRYPINGEFVQDLACMNIIVAKPDSEREDQMFEIYKITTPIGGVVTVYAKHISYMLASIPAPPFNKAQTGVKNSFATLKSFSRQLVPHGFNFSVKAGSNVASSTAEMEHSKPSSVREALKGTEGSIVDIFGGELEFDNTDVILCDKIGKKSSAKIRYGVNMTSFEQNENMSSVYTALYPYALQTAVDDNGKVVTNAITLNSLIAVDNAPYTKVKVADLTSMFTDDAGTQADITEETLLEAAYEYIAQNQWGIPDINIKVSFVSLAQTEEYKDIVGIDDIGYGDTVRVEYPALGIEAESRCVKTVYNSIIEKYETIEVGNVKKTIVETIANLRKDVKRRR